MNTMIALLACKSAPALPPGPVTEHWVEGPSSVAITFPADGVASPLPQGIFLMLPGQRWGQPSITLIAEEVDGDFSQKRTLANGARLRYDQRQTAQERMSISVLTGELTLGGQRFGVECQDFRETEQGADALRWCEPWLGTLRRVEPKP